MTEYQGEKFKIYLDKKDISVAKAAETLEVSRQNIYGLFKSANLSTETVKKILDKFSTTEEDIWPKEPRLEAKPISLADPYGEYSTGEKIYQLPDGQKVMEVKIVPAKVQAGYLRGFPDPEYYEDLPTLTINVNGNHTGTYLAFEVKGDSMTPTRVEDIGDAILEGWYVVGRELSRNHWKSKLHTHKHSYWVIVHKTEGILIKNIKEHDVERGLITIHSLNEAYEDEVLHLEDIEQIFSGIKRIVNDR
jgi:phage repressor protein C with HTH and peptisase S24 domain